MSTTSQPTVMAMSFRKQRDDAPAGFFEAEAAGLRWLGEVTDGATVVEVLDVGAGFVELARVADGAASAAAGRAFGAALARTHRAGASDWGAPPDGWTGPTFIGRQAMTLSSDSVLRRLLRRAAGAAVPAEGGRPRPRGRGAGAAGRSRPVTGCSPATSTTPRPRPGSTATCGPATCCGRPPGSASSTRPRTAATGRPTWRCWRCSAARGCPNPAGLRRGVAARRRLAAPGPAAPVAPARGARRQSRTWLRRAADRRRAGGARAVGGPETAGDGTDRPLG